MGKQFLWCFVFLFTALLLAGGDASAFIGQAAKPAVKQVEKQIGKTLLKNETKHVIGGSSATLAKNLKNVPSGFQAHHIIPVECKTHPALNKIGFNLDDAMNGIALPGRPGMDPKLPVHRGYHSDYSQSVRRELDKIPANLSEEATRSRVMGVISKFRTEIESGRSLYRTNGAPNAWK